MIGSMSDLDLPLAGPRAAAATTRRAQLWLLAVAFTSSAAALLAQSSLAQSSLTQSSLGGGGLGDHPGLMLCIGAALALAGGLLAAAPAALVGIAAMAGFPVNAVVDLIRGGDHSLLPIEFALYGVYMGLGAVVARVGRRLVRRAVPG